MAQLVRALTWCAGTPDLIYGKYGNLNSMQGYGGGGGGSEFKVGLDYVEASFGYLKPISKQII